MNQREVEQEAYPSEKCRREETKTKAAANPEDVQIDGWACIEMEGIVSPETKRPKLEEKSPNLPAASVRGETKLLEAISSDRSDEPKDQSVKLPRPTKDGALKKTVELKLQKSKVLQRSDASPVDGSGMGGDHCVRCKAVGPALQQPHQSSTNTHSSQATASKLPMCARDQKPVVRKNPPPPLFAPPGVPPAEYTSVILRSFDSYFIQLLAAQRKQLHRIAWGEPVVSSRKQPSHTLDWKGPRRQQKRLCSEHNLILSTVKTTPHPSAAVSIATPSNSPSTTSASNAESTERNEIEPQRTLQTEPTLSPEIPSTTTPSRRGKLSLGRRSFRSGDTGPKENRDASLGTSTSTGHVQAFQDNTIKGQSAGRTPQKDLESIASTRSGLLRPSRLHEFHDSDDDFEAAVPAGVPTPISHGVELVSAHADRLLPRTETDDVMEITPSVTPSPPPQSIQALSEDQNFLRNSPCSQQSHLSTGIATPASNGPGERATLRKRTKATYATGHNSDSSDSSVSDGARPTAKDDEWINPKARRSRTTVPSRSSGRDKRGRGIARGRKKKAHFMEDSESDSDGRGDGIAPQKASKRNIAIEPPVKGKNDIISSILGSSATPATCTRSSTKPQKPNATPAKPPPNVSSPSPSLSPSPSPPSPSSNLFSGPARERRQKRGSYQLPGGKTGQRQTAIVTAKGFVTYLEACVVHYSVTYFDHIVLQ